ncbi:hypothetical protein [Acholeplasma laidlawii]|uniref:hypothetical protein n=1 Tax=Acholeplasma laidlawii TaxID=2148 RepID=UPI00084C5A93|nr:hypothetical protein [Acholeplasma laidlawii]OED58580.1 hypothetical protein BHS12_02160 [Acholeplasma laidlawii]
MKKKIIVNPAIYPVFIIAIVGTIILIQRLITTETYINTAQEVATYIYMLAMAFSVFYLGRYIIKPVPLSYDNNEIVIKMYFRNDVRLSYKEIVKAEYYNRYMRLIIHTKHKKYKFTFVIKTSELKEILKKKVKDSDF